MKSPLLAVSYLLAKKTSCSAELSMKKFYNLGARSYVYLYLYYGEWLHFKERERESTFLPSLAKEDLSNNFEVVFLLFESLQMEV